MAGGDRATVFDSSHLARPYHYLSSRRILELSIFAFFPFTAFIRVYLRFILFLVFLALAAVGAPAGAAQVEPRVLRLLTAGAAEAERLVFPEFDFRSARGAGGETDVLRLPGPLILSRAMCFRHRLGLVFIITKLIGL
jgi:hypothetical protein